MQLLFADEFGDFSSRMNRADPGFRPICGYGGFIIPGEHYKRFADNFYRLRIVADKNLLFAKMPNSSFIADMYRNDGLAAAMRYELKGRDVFSTSYVNRSGPITPAWKQANVFQYARWFLRMLASHGAEIAYAGIEKETYFKRRAKKGQKSRRSLHVELVRGILDTGHQIAKDRKSQTKFIFDHHPKDDETFHRNVARNYKMPVHATPELQTRQEYCREILIEREYYDYVKEPFFHVPSEWSAGIQAADWICTIVTKVKSYEADRTEFQRYKQFYDRLGEYVDNMTASESAIRHFARPPRMQLQLPLAMP